MSEGGNSKKARTVGFGAFLAALVALLVVAALAGYIFYTDSNNYRALQQSYDQQAQVIAGLAGNYSSLYNDYLSLASNYTALSSQYSVLQAAYSALQLNYINMTQIANLQKNQTIASGTVLHIPMNSFESLEIETPYAGYIQVQLQATKPVSLLLTNYRHLTTIDYPISGSAISTGSFILPVLDGSNYLEIYAPSSSDTTVTISVTLVY